MTNTNTHVTVMPTAGIITESPSVDVRAPDAYSDSTIFIKSIKAR